MKKALIHKGRAFFTLAHAGYPPATEAALPEVSAKPVPKSTD